MALIEKEEADRDVRILAERMAMLYSHFVHTLCDRYGAEETRGIVRDVIKTYGEECGALSRKAVLDQGLENTLPNHACSQELPCHGWIARTEHCDEQEKLVRTEYCPFAATWIARGEEEWGRLYCFVDQAKFSTYCEGLETVHEENMLDGASCCLMRVTKKD